MVPAEVVADYWYERQVRAKPLQTAIACSHVAICGGPFSCVVQRRDSTAHLMLVCVSVRVSEGSYEEHSGISLS